MSRLMPAAPATSSIEVAANPFSAKARAAARRMDSRRSASLGINRHCTGVYRRVYSWDHDRASRRAWMPAGQENGVREGPPAAGRQAATERGAMDGEKRGGDMTTAQLEWAKLEWTEEE